MDHKQVLKQSLKNINKSIQRKPAFIWTNILLTRKCTQRCLHCSIPLNATEKDIMKLGDYKLILDRLEQYGTQVISLSGGDPMLHPQLRECVQYAQEKRFAKIHLLSTLYGAPKMIEKTIQMITETGISVSVSFDGFGEIADRLRGGKNVAEIVMNSIDRLQQENKTRKIPISIGANIVISRLNLHQVPQILEYLESRGIATDVDIYRWASSHQREDDELKMEDSPEFRQVLERVISSPVVFTPRWLLRGLPDYLNHNSPKYCPYLDAPSLGSKFFIEPDGDVKVCLGEPVGNLLRQTPDDIFQSGAWDARLEEFRQCKGCWNTCYTSSARLLHPTNVVDGIRALKLFRK